MTLRDEARISYTMQQAEDTRFFIVAKGETIGFLEEHRDTGLWHGAVQGWGGQYVGFVDDHYHKALDRITSVRMEVIKATKYIEGK